MYICGHIKHNVLDASHHSASLHISVSIHLIGTSMYRFYGKGRGRISKWGESVVASKEKKGSFSKGNDGKYFQSVHLFPSQLQIAAI
jgi:hypothetical protein